jgi:hypothetical protein
MKPYRFEREEAVMVQNKDRVVQTGLRIRASLRDRLEKEAKRSGISLNSEMERRLEASFAVSRVEEKVDETNSKLARLMEALADTPLAARMAAAMEEKK